MKTFLVALVLLVAVICMASAHFGGFGDRGRPHDGGHHGGGHHPGRGIGNFYGRFREFSYTSELIKSINSYFEQTISPTTLIQLSAEISGSNSEVSLILENGRRPFTCSGSGEPHFSRHGFE